MENDKLVERMLRGHRGLCASPSVGLEAIYGPNNQIIKVKIVHNGRILTTLGFCEGRDCFECWITRCHTPQ